MSTGKEQEIVEEARRYVEALLYSGRVSKSISSAQASDQIQMAQASAEEEAQILARLTERIARLSEDVSQKVNPPTNALNALVVGTDAPVYFDHEGHEYRVVPSSYVPAPQDKFRVERKDGDRWVSVNNPSSA